MSFKKGDRVVLIKAYSLNDSPPVGTTLTIHQMLGDDGFYTKDGSYYHLHRCIPEKLYNSRLYKALQEEEQ